jgi:hypothetical protein
MYNIDSNNKRMLIILKIVFLVCFWFSFGVYLYFKLENGNSSIIKKIFSVIQRLNFLELFLILFVIYCLFSFFLQFIVFNLLGEYTNLFIDPNISNATSSTGTDTSPVSKSSSSDTSGLSKASDGAIMAAAISGGAKLAQKMPNTAAKVVSMAGSVALGAGAIITKNVVGNVSENFGKDITKSKFSSETISILSDLFNLTGNSVLDLLTLIQFFQSCQMTFLILIIYYSILYNIKESIIEKFLNKIFPTKIVLIFMKSVNLFKKSGLILIIWMIILLIVSTFLSIHYFDFFVNNFDKICELYINSKK